MKLLNVFFLHGISYSVAGHICGLMNVRRFKSVRFHKLLETNSFIKIELPVHVVYNRMCVVFAWLGIPTLRNRSQRIGSFNSRLQW